MSKSLILALDIGTSSVRAALYDETGEPLRHASIKHVRTLDATSDGGSEIDAVVAFDQVVAAIDDLLDKTSGIKGEINYVASCSFWHSLMGVDSSGRPTTKVLSWADTRSRDYSATLRKKFDETDTHNRTGAHFHSSFWPAKLLWLRKDSPDIFAKTTRWLSFSDFVALRLFGIAATSVSMASGTGLFDIRKCDWDPRLLKFLKIKKENLPEIAHRDRGVLELSLAFKNRWPRLANTKWFPNIADGAADNIGAGCVTRDKAALMVGTSGAMRVVYRGEPPEEIPQGLWCYRVDRKRVVIGGALSDGGGLYQWLLDNLKLASNAEAEIANRGAAAHGLIFLPFLAGERSTGYNESATGAIFGLSASHDSVDILQAGLEGVAYRFAEIYDRLKNVTKIRNIVASGGALRNLPLWTQIIADVFGVSVHISPARESSSRGAVLLALETLGKIENIESLPIREPEMVSFHPECHAIYQKARKQHLSFYDSKIFKNQ